MRYIPILLIFVTALPAQRNELSLQFGGTLTQRRAFSLPAGLQSPLGTDALQEDNGFAGGIVYRVRVVRFGPAALLAELPIFVVQATNTDLIPLIARPAFGDTSGVAGFLTPGGVVRFLPEARFSPFVLAGAGYARVVEAQLVSIAPLRGRFVNEGTWAVSYGGGADLPLFRFLAIRGELRNFYTGATVTEIPLQEEVRQRNTLLLTAGFVFRF